MSLVQCAPHRGHGRIEMSGVMQALQAGAIRVAGLQAASFGAAGTSAHMLAQRNNGPESNVTNPAVRGTAIHTWLAVDPDGY